MTARASGNGSGVRGSLAAARALCLVAYVVAGAAAVAMVISLRGRHPLLVAAAADVVATVVVFAFSRAFDNSSFYDPYWSVAPPMIGLYWIGTAPAASPTRQAIALTLVTLWATRLTWNWLRGWTGLGHEDWRYADMRARSGRAYWLVSFLGIHLFPTAIVLVACLPLYPALTGERAAGALDVLAALVTLTAIAIEATADEQLRRFRRVATAPGQTLVTGLWATSRHPNYFGEMLFWWGLFLFGVAANPGAWWTVVGPLAITAMFFVVSIPMIDRRMLARRPGYERRMREVSAVVPWFPGR